MNDKKVQDEWIIFPHFFSSLSISEPEYSYRAVLLKKLEDLTELEVERKEVLP